MSNATFVPDSRKYMLSPTMKVNKLTAVVMPHLRLMDQFWGFSGSLSPSQPTKEESFFGFGGDFSRSLILVGRLSDGSQAVEATEGVLDIRLSKRQMA